MPESITTVATNRPEACLGVTSPYPTMDRLQREPKTPADRRILLMVENLSKTQPADHHREHGDDPGSPMRSQRICQQQTRRQRNLPGRSTDSSLTSCAWRRSTSLG